MAFIKTTLTDELTGKNSEFCFNTEYVVSLQPARNTTVLKFADGQKVDMPYEALLRYFGAQDKLMTKNNKPACPPSYESRAIGSASSARTLTSHRTSM
jgi:hypothetical protein